MTVRIINADCRDALREMDADSVHCVVTSPPYWGLRDYGVSGQIGLEASVAEHVEALRDVFCEVRRVLRPDGTLWLNYGDAYAGSWGAQSREKGVGPATKLSATQVAAAPKATHTGSIRDAGLKPKDLMGLPWRLAFALQADGWWLRSDIIWSKPNPMPESIKDRPTKAHEYIFLMTKRDRYYYDAAAIAEPRNSVGGSFVNGWATEGEHTAAAWARDKGNAKTFRGGKYTGGRPDAPRTSRGNAPAESETKNARTVWEVATEPFPEAHFATFPPSIAERCIQAGCPVGGTVLDPFGGAGTTGLVADRLQRNAVLIELNPEYAAMARKRIERDAPMFVEVSP